MNTFPGSQGLGIKSIFFNLTVEKDMKMTKLSSEKSTDVKEIPGKSRKWFVFKGARA